MEFVLYLGPAGTGKTESVKALGHQLGRFVLVFNCDETFDFQVLNCFQTLRSCHYHLITSIQLILILVILYLTCTPLVFFFPGYGSYLCWSVPGGGMGLL